ncbi:polysaccharide pyruvyl transferase family protein [Mycetocola zhadangensis]|uniref:polysaccharide pyruvyl transferase family protein n=1 Tax=Mycetocola zhadangensis TaxID=1164595 RepID=UPI003A4E22F5
MLETKASLLFDSVSANTGDIAMGIASEQIFSTLGISTEIVDPLSPDGTAPLLVGGGELIRNSGDAFYDLFRRRGRHILHAAGIWTTSDNLDYLNDYASVSTRSTRELERLAETVPSAQVLPCATTMIESPHYEIPGMDSDEPVIGIHLVPHALRLIEDLIPIVNAIPYRKVFIPFTHYNGDESFMRSLPFDMSNATVLGKLAPLELHSVLGQMSSVLVSSLHASIFSYSQNVPFISVHQPKVEYYFNDRGLGDHLVKSGPELTEMLRRLSEEKFDFTASVEQDKNDVLEAYKTYARILTDERHATPSFSESDLSSATVPGLEKMRETIFIEQGQHVIADHDLAMAYVENRRLALANSLMESRRKLSDAEAVVEALEAWWVRRAAMRVKDKLRRARDWVLRRTPSSA